MSTFKERITSYPRPIFEHAELPLPKLKRLTIDGIRYYKIEDSEELKTFISVTSITSNYSKEKIQEWKNRVGEEEANRVIKYATTLGTQYHALVESYFKNETVPEKSPMAMFLLTNARKILNRIGKIFIVEKPLYSPSWELAGTPDMIAEFDGVLSVIDHKTSEFPKKEEWIEGYFVQCFAYAMMPKQLVIIMSCQNGEVVTYIKKDLSVYAKILRKYVNKFIKDKSNETV